MFFRKFAALALLCMLVLVQRSSAQGGASARIFFVDIGQGAGTLIVSPTGKTLLMDGGPTGEGTTKIAPLLTTLGIAALDYTVVSHYHIDHISGITELLNAGRVAGTAYDVGDGFPVEPPVAGGTRTAYLNYKSATNRPGVTRQTLAPGTVIDLGGGMTATAMVVAGRLLSGGAIPITDEDLNSESISLLIQFNDFDFVVAGDLTGGGSTSTNKVPDIESYVGQLTGDVDVVQLSHHGSTTTTSQAYLSAIRAEVAVAQASENNTFGHPNREPVNKFLNTPTTTGASFSGTTVPPAAVAPVFYQPQASHPTDDRVTRQAHSGAAFGNAGNGTLELRTDGVTFYTMTSFDDSGARISASIHSYPVDGASAGVAANFAPTVITSIDPAFPLASDTVTVSAAINDAEDPIGLVTLSYAVNGVAQAPIAMTLVSGAYQAAIPAQANGARVDYAVTAAAGTHSTTSALGYFSGITPIASVKQVNAKGEPLYFNYPARINAAVTAGTGTFATGAPNDDYLQDVSGGINLFRTFEPAVPAIQPTQTGHFVEARGLIAFFGGKLRLDLSPTLGGPPVSPLGVSVLSTTSAVTPHVTTIAAVNANPEAFEGMLLSIAGASVVAGTIPASPAAVDGILTITDGTGNLSLKIDKDTSLPGMATPGGTFTAIGIVQQDDFLRPFDSGYSLTPRSRVDLGGVDPGTVVQSIASARIDQVSNANGTPGADTIPDLIGQQVRVRGVVTSVDFRGASGLEIYIQDSTGGVDIFNTTNAATFNIGDSVEVVGLLAQFNGLTEIDPGANAANLTLLPPGTMPAANPQLVTIGQVTESLEGRLVRIDNVSTATTGVFAPNAETNLNVSDATGSMVIRVDRDTDLDGTPIPTGPFSVIGVVGQFDSSQPFDSGYQIFPRSTADLIAGPAPVLVLSPAPLSFGNVNVGLSTPLPLTITNVSAASVTLVTPLAITGTDLSQFSVAAPGATTLTPGAATTAMVSFSPTSGGAKTATLTVTAAGGISAGVALNGTGQVVAPPVGTPLVISEFRFRGPSGGNDEFVEIYNNTDDAIMIGGYTLRGSNNAGTNSVRATVAPSTTIPARGHFLFTNSGASGYSGSVAGNQTYTVGITDDGGIALARGDGTIVDQVGLSAGSAYKEGTPLASLGNTTASNLNRSYERKPGGAAGSGTDTTNNAADFQLITPSDPQNLASAPTPLPCPGVIVSGAPPNGVATIPYSTMFSASGGTPPYSFSSTGSLPPGLTLAADGTLSGTPGTAGTFAFSVVATDAASCGGSAPFSVTIDGAATLTAGARSFGITAIGGSTSQLVSVSNASSFAVTLTPPFVISGANAGEFSVAALAPNVNPGALVSLPVTFSPTSAGAKTATLTITSTNAGSVDVVLTGLATAKTAAAGLVISEFRFRGPGGGNDEFVEIYNPTSSPILMTGYRLSGSNGSGVNSTRATVSAAQAIPPFGHFLFANSGAYSGAAPADQLYGTGITDDGGVALVDPSGLIVDAVGTSAGSVFKEGTPLASLGTANLDRSYERLPGGFDGATVDTDVNSNDFVLRTGSAPQNTASASTPSIATSVDVVDFGAIAAGTSASAALTIANVGGTTVTFATPFTITGAGAADFFVDAPADAAIDPGAATSVNVSFSPIGIGPRSAVLNVTTTDGETRTVSLTGTAICPLITVSGTPVDGQYGSPYSHLFTAGGGRAPYTISTAGPIPPGLTLSNDGELSGTPTSPGAFTFDVQAADANGCAATATVSLTIARAPLSVVADNATREYGEPNPVFTGTLTGAIAGDGLSASFASAATPSSAPGTYPIVATINDPLGRLANYIVSITNGTLTITDASTPGLMLGNAGIDTTDVDYDLEFRVRERSSGAEAGHVRFDVATRGRGRDETHRFRSTQVDEVSFLDTPGTTPGRRPASGVDAVLFTGRGTWDGDSGYRFEARATDAGEPGRNRDSFTITIRDAAGAVVATIDGVITQGNIQSLRTR